MHRCLLGSARFCTADPTFFFGAVRLFSQPIKDFHVGWARGPRTVVGFVVTPGAPIFGLGSATCRRPLPTLTYFRCSARSGRTDNRSRTSGPTYIEIFDQLAENRAPHRKKVRVGTERPTGADPNPKVGAVPGLGVFFAYSRSPIHPAFRTAIGFAVPPTAPLLHRNSDRVGIT